MRAFTPYPDAPVNGVGGPTSARIQLPRPGGSVDVRIAWEGGAGWIRFGDETVEVSDADGMRLPTESGVEVLRVPTTATHLAYIGPSINLVAGDGL